MRQQVGQVALAQFQNRSLNTTARLLLTDDTDGFLNQVSTVEKVSQNQNSALQDYQSEQAALASLERSTATDLAQLEAQQQSLAELRTQSDGKITEAKAVLAKLTEAERQRIAAEEARLAQAAQQDANAVTTTDPTTTPTDGGGAVAGSGRAAKAIAFAKAQLGKPYVYAAAGPNAYDCSGLTSAAWKAAGVHIPRTSQAQFGAGTSVAKSDLQPGDLVFFYSGISHVAHLCRQRHDHPCAASRCRRALRKARLDAVRRRPPRRLTTVSGSRPFRVGAGVLALLCVLGLGAGCALSARDARSEAWSIVERDLCAPSARSDRRRAGDARRDSHLRPTRRPREIRHVSGIFGLGVRRSPVRQSHHSAAGRPARGGAAYGRSARRRAGRATGRLEPGDHCYVAAESRQRTLDVRGLAGGGRDRPRRSGRRTGGRCRRRRGQSSAVAHPTDPTRHRPGRDGGDRQFQDRPVRLVASRPDRGAGGARADRGAGESALGRRIGDRAPEQRRRVRPGAGCRAGQL